jgi:hypothetical protein
VITRTLLLTALAAAFAVAPAQADVISYNGHAGLGSSVYQHNQSDREFIAMGSIDAHAASVTDGTSNTIFVGARTVTSMADMGGQFFS